MANVSKEHEKELGKLMRKLRKEGYNVIKTYHKIPDAIACKDGKIYAVEMMGQKWSSNKKWKNKHSKAEKERDYSNFDGLLFGIFRYKKRITLKEEQAYFE